MKDILKTVQRTEETDKHPCAVCNHTEKEFKDLHAALTASAQRVEAATVLVRKYLSCPDPSLYDLEDAIRQLAQWKVTEQENYATHEAMLKHATAAVEAMRGGKDQAYLERNHLVALLARLFPSGIRKTNIEGWSDDWHGCVYIDLPSGQISYHYHDSHAYLFAGLPAYTKEWDGHDKVIVHRRLHNTVTAAVEEMRGAAKEFAGHFDNIPMATQVSDSWHKLKAALAQHPTNESP